MSGVSDLHPLAAAYLERMREAARDLPRPARDELLADIEGHLREATHPEMGEAEVLTVLDRLGDPEEIVAVQRGDAAAESGFAADSGTVVPPAPEQRRLGLHEVAAIVLLLVGGFVFIFGWLVGVVLLWTSSAWRIRDKVIGTLLLPGGLTGAAVLLLTVIATKQECITKRIRVGGAPVPHTSPGGIFPTSLGCHTVSGGLGAPFGVIVAGLVVAIPLATAVYLVVQARRPDRAHPPERVGVLT